MAKSTKTSLEAAVPSKSTAVRLKEIRKQSLQVAALSCLGNQGVHVDSSEIITHLIEGIRETKRVPYLEEPTVAPKEPANRAFFQINKGFKTSDREFWLQSPFNWDGADGAVRNTKYKLQSWLMIDAQIVAAASGREDPHLDIAYKIALDWIDTFIFKTTTKAFVWYDMAVGQRATKIAYLLHKALIDNAEQKIVLPLLIAADIHMIELMQKDRIAVHSNHGLFQMSGLLALASSHPGLRHSERGKKLSQRFIHRMVKDHFTSDGLHKEHSPEYHIFMTNYLSQLSETGWLSEDSELIELTRRSLSMTEWLIQPDGHILPLGDSKNIPATQRLRYAPKFTKATVKGFFIGGLGVSRMLSEEAQPIEQLTLSAQFHSRQHKHADELSFHLSSAGEQLFVDGGTYSYNYDTRERKYVESTRAHNAIEIDGLNTSRFIRDSYGSGLDIAESAGRLAVLSGKIHHLALNNSDTPYNKYTSSDRKKVNITHRRILVHDPGRFIVVVDLLDSKNQHEYVQWFHLHPKFSVNSDGEGCFTAVCDADKKSAQINILSDIDETLIIKGQEEPDFQGWTCLNGTQLEPSTAIGFKRKGESTSIVTIIHLGDSDIKIKRFKENEKGLEFTIESDGTSIDIEIPFSEKSSIVSIHYGSQAHYIYTNVGGS